MIKNIKKIIKLALSSLLLVSFITSASPYDAARRGDLDALRSYRFETKDLFIPDSKGFIPYELAALHADSRNRENLQKYVEIMLWLKEYKPENHIYGKASISLVQAGLNALNYNAGTVDGFIGEDTKKAIKSFQSKYDLSETGTMGPHWLGVFYRELMADTQKKLTKLGYKTFGVDGIYGPKTNLAILKFSKDKKLANSEYQHLSASLIRTINSNLERKEIIQKKESIAYLQAGLRTLGYEIGAVDGIVGGRTLQALKEFQKKYKLKVTGEINKETKMKMDWAFLKETQRKLSYLGYKLGKPDGMTGGKTKKAILAYAKANKITSKGSITASLVESIDNTYDTKIAKLEAVKKAKSDKVAAAKRAADKKIANKKKKIAAKRAADKKKKEKATKLANNPKGRKPKTKEPKGKQVKQTASNDVVIKGKPKAKPKPKATPKPKKVARTTRVNSREARGSMVFRKSGGRVVGCSIKGRKIPIEWCEPFYPLPKNNRCEASFKSNGKVINLFCK